MQAQQQDDNLLTIGENLHIFNPAFRQAVEQQNQASLTQLAGQHLAGGARSLAINLGPARSMHDRLPWVVETIQQHSPTPLFLPAISNGLEQALECHQGRATINAVTADPAHLDKTMKIARDYEADLVVLLTKPGLQNFDTQHRLQIALDVLEQADGIGLPREQLYLDPVLSVRTDPVAWNLTGGMPDLDPILQTIALIGELSAGQVQTIVGLSNGTLGLSPHKRSSLHCRMLPLLAQSGLDAVILNSLDQTLMNIAGCLKRSSLVQRKAA